jgi:hypothetical protein
VQPVLQLVALAHPNWPGHDAARPATQLPAPSHALAVNIALEASHEEPHGVLGGGYAHCADVPPQAPPHAVPAAAQAARVPCGGPLETSEQVPSWPATSHASQSAAQGESQQNPSTHTPDVRVARAPVYGAHCSFDVHVAPTDARILHACVGVQYALAAQSPSVLHGPAHAAPAHA